MAPTTITTATVDESKVAIIKTLTDPGAEINSVPTEYTYVKNPTDQADASDPKHSIPTIDFAHLISSNPKLHADAVEKLGQACEEWGFFQVINHGVPESLMRSMIDACHKFFVLPEEEKKEFQSSYVLEPIKWGAGSNMYAATDNVRLWRAYLKVIAHPEFHSLHKPKEYSDVSFEFSKQSRNVATELLSGISESLGLEAGHIAKAINWDRGLQILAANYYPVCPQPDLAIGIPPHTDHATITLLIQNDMGGLQVQHDGKWVSVDYAPGAFVVNIGDQMQILTNDKYKSVWHRAVVNNKATRISMAVPHGPELDTAALPIPELLNGEAPKYIGRSYKEFIELQASPAGNYVMPCLELLRVKAE